jgi:acetoin utilization deacetylase AcuC-like enzyme
MCFNGPIAGAPVKAFTSDHFVLPLPEGHKFPMAKYTMLRRRVAASGLLEADDLVEAAAAANADLIRVHDADYVRRVAHGRLDEREVRRLGFPWSPQLVERSRRSVGATIGACRAALEDGVGVNLAGGTHHAFADRGEGFCVFNDSAVAARAMQAEGRARRVLVIDCDVHQGNGTAAIFSGDRTVFTFSIHGAGNYPYRKETSDLDVALPDGTRDEAYLAALDRALPEAVERAKAELAIYISGADPHEGDRFGRLRMTAAGLAERDRRVLGACREAGLPVAVSMAGGYGRDIPATVAIHFATVAIAAGSRALSSPAADRP